jgi:[calcium/calmodulin-dependent protein kinase] kinase
MHAKNFIHKDIKPDNILISKNKQAKLGDLGISMCASSGNSQLRNMVNTHYGAP